jgi:transcriptional antiterminator RfaH
LETWFAVATKPRCEAQAEEHLRRQGYDCLLPRVRRVLRNAAGVKTRVESLFPNYLFLRADSERESLAPVRSTRGAIGLVRFGMEPARVPEPVIARILARIDAADGLVRLDTPTLAPGSTVRVTTGPLCGWEGVFVAGEGSERVRLLLDLLGSVREVVLPREQLALRL